MGNLLLPLVTLVQVSGQIPSAGVQILSAKTGKLSCLFPGDEGTVRAEIDGALKRIATQCCKPNVAGVEACVRIVGTACISGQPPGITKRTFGEAVAACAEIGVQAEGFIARGRDRSNAADGFRGKYPPEIEAAMAHAIALDIPGARYSVAGKVADIAVVAPAARAGEYCSAWRKLKKRASGPSSGIV